MEIVNKWVRDNYKSLRKDMLKISRNDVELVDDLLHECILIFIEHKKAVELIERNEAKWFIVRIALNQYRSTTSHFYRKFKRKSLRLNEDINIEIENDVEYDYDLDELINLNINIIEELLKSDNAVERHYGIIVMLYFSNGHNFAEVARCLDIPRTTIRRQFDDATKIILKKMKEKRTDIEYNDLPLKILTTELLKGYGRKRRF